MEVLSKPVKSCPVCGDDDLTYWPPDDGEELGATSCEGCFWTELDGQLT